MCLHGFISQMKIGECGVFETKSQVTKMTREYFWYYCSSVASLYVLRFIVPYILLWWVSALLEVVLISPLSFLFRWMRQFIFVSTLGLLHMSERAKRVKQLVFSVIDVSESMVMIAAVCWIEHPVSKENDLINGSPSAKTVIYSQNDCTADPNLWNLQLFNSWTVCFYMFLISFWNSGDMVVNV